MFSKTEYVLCGAALLVLFVREPLSPEPYLGLLILNGIAFYAHWRKRCGH